MIQIVRAFVLTTVLAFSAAGAATGGALLVGWASVDITPNRPVALAGQFHTRVSKSVHDPITATVLVIEKKQSSSEQAIMISCDLVVIEPGFQKALVQRIKQQLPDFDSSKLFLNATHTHTAPETRPGQYQIPEGVMSSTEYVAFLVDRLVPAVAEAWRGRKPAGVSWGLGQAVVGHNRRAIYENGSARMYGKTDGPDFRRIEGHEDHGVELLYVWDAQDKLTGVVINVSCPSQVVEGQYYVSADFWNDVRTVLRKRHSDKLFIYPMTGAGGDQSPHLLFRRKAEDRLRERLGITETEDIARRIADAVDCVLPAAQKDIRRDVPFVHSVKELQLPVRKITEADVAQARDDFDRISKLPETDRARYVQLNRAKNVIRRYDTQLTEPFYPMTLHVIRLGDIAIATNSFELYLDYGIQMKARSRAEQTFIVQLAGRGTYLPTAKAVAAGHYGAEAASNMVGPEGGQMLVENTVETINAMWEDGAKVGTSNR